MNNYDINRQMLNFNIKNNINMNNNNISNNNLAGLYTGYIRGNMFNNLYDQYRNYKPAMLNPRNEKEQYLLDLNQAQFAMHDIHLYLDNFPNDNNMINEFNKNRDMYMELLKEYENRFGPLEICSDSLNNVPWQWNNEPWPWERSDN
ncbi:MAG: spore coat protein CotJB [Bacilli bacterium]|nr:spore coat protein CotJB [Bacilli bacterium]